MIKTEWTKHEGKIEVEEKDEDEDAEVPLPSDN